MDKQPAKIDTAKLRRLLQERRQRFQAARDLTDRFLEIKSQIGELEAANQRHRLEYPGREVNETNVAQIEHLKGELSTLSEEREQAGQRAQAMGYVERLVEHARKLGFEVDERTGSIRAVRPPAKPAGPYESTGWDGHDPRATYIPGAPYGQ